MLIAAKSVEITCDYHRCDAGHFPSHYCVVTGARYGGTRTVHPLSNIFTKHLYFHQMVIFGPIDVLSVLCDLEKKGNWRFGQKGQGPLLPPSPCTGEVTSVCCRTKPSSSNKAKFHFGQIIWKGRVNLRISTQGLLTTVKKTGKQFCKNKKTFLCKSHPLISHVTFGIVSCHRSFCTKSHKQTNPRWSDPRLSITTTWLWVFSACQD